MYNLQVMQEDNTGQELNTWYVYDHDNNEVLCNEWFETEKEAQDYLDWFLIEHGTDADNGMEAVA